MFNFILMNTYISIKKMLELKHYLGLLLFIMLFSCAYQSTKKEQKSEATNNVLLEKPHQDTLSNGLSLALKGEWINTALFDSTLLQKKLQPWLGQFYGDLYLKIDSSDIIVANGNMDGGETTLEAIDSLSFTIANRVDHPLFVYLKKENMIQLTKPYYPPMLFRKVKPTDNLEIIGNEEAFNEYFIKRLFLDDYFDHSNPFNITAIWNGFLTYQPFDFDALVIEDQDGKSEIYGWEIKDGVLKLYATSYTVDEESGFAIYSRGKFVKQYYAKKK